MSVPVVDDDDDDDESRRWRATATAGELESDAGAITAACRLRGIPWLAAHGRVASPDAVLRQAAVIASTKLSPVVVAWNCRAGSASLRFDALGFRNKRSPGCMYRG